MISSKLIAAFFLSLTVAELPASGSTPAPRPRAEQSQEEAASDLQTTSAAEVCKPAPVPSRSEVCAAWASADAAAYSVWLSFWQMVIGAAGLLGLLYSLHLNRRATNAATAANEDTARSVAIAERNADAAAELVQVSQRAAEAELRSYLDFKNVKLIFDPRRDSTTETCMGVRIEVENFGRTPASNVIMAFTLSVVSKSGEEGRQVFSDTLSVGVIAPSDHCGGNLWVHLSNSEAEEIRSIVKFMGVDAEVTYADVFEKEHIIKSAFEGINHDHFSTIEGTRVAT